MYEEHSPVGPGRYSKLARKLFREKEKWHKSRARMSYAKKLEALSRMLEMYRDMPKPQFPSYEEEATWWDTHDAVDYIDESRPIKVRFASDFTHSIQIPFKPKDFLALSHVAEAMGTDIISLAKSWILERLKEEGK